MLGSVGKYLVRIYYVANFLLGLVTPGMVDKIVPDPMQFFCFLVLSGFDSNILYCNTMEKKRSSKD